MSRKGSLWSELSASTRFELIPIISTAILVQAGEATADAVVRLSHLALFVEPNSIAVTDVTGMLLLVNLPIVVWFAYRTLKESFAAGTPVKLDTKLVGLSTAFLTSADLLAYGVKSHHLGRTLYALLVLLFVFAVPFFLIRRLPVSSAASPEQDDDVGRHALGAMALVVCAVVPAIAAVLAATLFEIALNDAGTPHSFVAGVLGQSGRTEYWGISPGVAGIAWAPIILCAYSWLDLASPPTKLGLDLQGMSILALASACIFAVLAAILIGDNTLWPAAGFVDTEIRCFHEAGGGKCNDGSSGVSSRSRRFD